MKTTAQRFFGKVLDALDTFESAREVAAAVENHRRPSAASLRKLGIDPKTFQTGLY